MSKWGEARANFRQLSMLSEAATRFLRENHPMFAQTVSNVATKNTLASNVSNDALNDGDQERQPARRGRPRKSNQFYEDREAEPRFLQKKRMIDDPEIINDDGQRRKRNVGIPRHFENMVLLEHHKKRRMEVQEREEDDANSLQDYDGNDGAAKRRRGRPSKAREELPPPIPAPTVVKGPIIQTADEIAQAPKRLTFPEFCDQLRDFFRVLGAWYGVSAPVILHYLREQILVS